MATCKVLRGFASKVDGKLVQFKKGEAEITGDALKFAKDLNLVEVLVEDKPVKKAKKAKKND